MEMVPVSLPRFEDYSYLEDHRTPTDGERKAKWLKHREIAWDNTTRKYTPMMLKGYRPITLEPYACCTALADTALSRTHPALLRASQASRKLHASECEIRRDAADCVWLPAAPRVCTRWADDSIRFGEERSLGFDPWGTGKSWEKEAPEVQSILFDQVQRYHDWRVKRERLKSVLQPTDEYRLLRA